MRALSRRRHEKSGAAELFLAQKTHLRALGPAALDFGEVIVPGEMSGRLGKLYEDGELDVVEYTIG
jgi:hypothetical protein